MTQVDAIEAAEVELSRVLHAFDYCMPADGMARVLAAYEAAKAAPDGAAASGVEVVRKHIAALGVGCCTCGTKSPDPQWHMEYCKVWNVAHALDALDDIATLSSTPPPVVEAGAVPQEVVAWRWRSRIKGGAWDAWERGRFGQEVPPFMEVEEQYALAKPTPEPAGEAVREDATDETIARVADAIDRAEIGYSLRLTRLVDEESTYTLTYADGEKHEFDDIDDGYAHIRQRRLKAQAENVIAALAASPAASPAPTGHVEIAHDGFAGTIQGRYVTREGKRGVVVQQDGTRVVHVYGEKWLTASPAPQGDAT